MKCKRIVKDCQQNYTLFNNGIFKNHQSENSSKILYFKLEIG